jgi:hypothetical protein
METDSATATPTATDGGTAGNGGSEQSTYVNDAWDKHYFNSHEAELNPDKAQKPEAKTPQAKLVVAPEGDKKPEAEKPKIDPKTGKEIQPDKQEPQPSRFEKAFTGEDGTLDVDKFLNFTLPESQEQAQKPLDLGVPGLEQTTEEQWKKDQEEVTNLSKVMNDGIIAPLEKVYILIKGGTDPVQALKSVYDEQKAIIDGHVNEIKTQKEFQRQKALEDRILEKSKSGEVAAQSRTNINEIASSLPGTTPEGKMELFRDILFGKETGAQLLDFYFQEKVPGTEKMKPEERSAAALKFVNEITSNKAKLRFVFNQALAIQTRANLPSILQKSRLSAVAADKANRLSAQKSPTGTQQRTAPPAGKSKWDGYFNSHYETADRV